MLTMIALVAPARADCTIGVADGTVSDDGRALLWKSRMQSGLPRNEVAYYSGSSYDYVGIRSQSGSAAMGLNSAGLATGNTLVGSGANYSFMNHTLTNYSSVSQVRTYVQDEFDAGRLNAAGCFPFMDAAGNATMFEIDHSTSLYEYTTTDADRAGQGLSGRVVRANEFHSRSDGTDDTSITGGRYESGNTNTSGLISEGELSAKTILQGNDGSSGYEFMRYGPGRSMSNIATSATCSSMIVHGVESGEDPALATMWTALGQPNYGIATPVWAAVSDVPESLSNGDMAARANALYATGNETDTQTSTLPAEALLYDEVDELLVHWRTNGVPSAAEMSRVEQQMAADAYSLLDCLDNTQADNLAPTVSQSTVSEDGLTMSFQASASDADGTIGAYQWDFGDGTTSTDASPVHTYDSHGWYLVSLTGTDDDGVSTTDWRHVGAAPEPSAVLMALGLSVAVVWVRWRRRGNGHVCGNA